VFEYLFRQHEPNPQEVLEILESYQLTFEFKQEQHYREAFEVYCQEYAAIAEQHQQEYVAMQNEPDIFRLFWKRRGTEKKGKSSPC